MTFKMVSFLLLLIIITVFSAFNLSNTSDISFGFYTLKDVPIFLSLLVAFIAGAIMMIPFTFNKKKIKSEKNTEKKNKKKKKDKNKEVVMTVDNQIVSENEIKTQK